MSTPDMDVIKEIPGYKVILKAVLKSQIQQLVEQLAAHTEEESIILTASVADGTLSHLGSDSGKSFLEDHEDVKSQFLGFCLKWHHKKNQEKEREEAMHIAAVNLSPCFTPSRPPVQQFTNFTRFHGSRGQSFRLPGMRHQPYPLARPVRAAPMNPNTQARPFSPLKSPNKIDGQIIKMEPNPNQENQNDENSSRPSSPSQTVAISSNVKNESSDKEDENSESSASTIANETPPEGLSLDSDLSNLILSSQISSSASQIPHCSDTDKNVCVKIEDVNDSEMDLEITGVELARPKVSQSSWTPNSSMGMNFEPLGAAGSPSDVQAAQHGYRCPEDVVKQLEAVLSGSDASVANIKVVQCEVCDRVFSSPCNMRVHMRTHTGEKPYVCATCGKTFTQNSSYYRHLRTQHQ